MKSSSCTISPTDIALPWVRTTPLGGPVVPDV
jgi:hypothetical protein